MKRKNVNKIVSTALAVFLAIGGVGWSAPVSALGSAESKPSAAPTVTPQGDQQEIAWISLAADGVANTTDTKMLTFTFDKEPTGLTADDITVTKADKGMLTSDPGVSNVRKLSISNLTAGENEEVTVSISLAGYTIAPSVQNVAVHRAPVLSTDAGLTQVADQNIIETGAGDGTAVDKAVTASISVPYSKDKIVTGDIITSDVKASKEMFAGTQSSPIGEISLTAGTPTHVYIKVTAEDTSIIRYYDITVTRTLGVLDAKLITVAGVEFSASGGLGTSESDPFTGQLEVPYSKTKIEVGEIKVNASENIKIELHKDPQFESSVSEISLERDTPTVIYIKLSAEGYADLYYKAEVTHAAAAKNADLSKIAEKTLLYLAGPGTQAEPTRGSITVSYSKSQIVRSDIELSDLANATMIMYSDSSFVHPVESIGVSAGGSAVVYLKITAEDGETVRYYAVTVERTSASSKADLLYVAEKIIKEGKGKGTYSSPKMASITVSSKTNAISTSDLEVSSGAEAKLYKDSKFSKTTSEVSLSTGDNTIYVIVTAEDSSTTQYYEIDVTRGSSSSSSKNSKSSSGSTALTSGGGGGGGSGFKDIENHWAQKSIEAMVSKGVFNGVDKNNFAPELTTNRAMMVTVLARLDKVYLVGFASPTFSDVPQGLWYSNSVEWAAEKKIVDGIGGGLFNPNGSVTREQMSVMLYNYMVFKGYRVPDGSGASAFGDEAKINSWSKDAVKAMQQAGIINGKPGNVFDPQGIATRAEVCTILDRFVKLYVN